MIDGTGKAVNYGLSSSSDSVSMSQRRCACVRGKDLRPAYERSRFAMDSRVGWAETDCLVLSLVSECPRGVADPYSWDVTRWGWGANPHPLGHKPRYSMELLEAGESILRGTLSNRSQHHISPASPRNAGHRVTSRYTEWHRWTRNRGGLHIFLNKNRRQLGCLPSQRSRAVDRHVRCKLVGARATRIASHDLALRRGIRERKTVRQTTHNVFVDADLRHERNR